MVNTNTTKNKSGFSLIEILVASSIFSLVMLGVFSAFSYSSRWTRAGTSQIRFLAKARVSKETITALIERGKAMSVTANGIKILFPDLTYGMIYFNTGDGNLSTVKDNTMIYDPTPGSDGDEYTICNYVRPVDGDSIEDMFTIVLNSPHSILIRFHIGDGTDINAQSFSGTGIGYQGTEIHIGASPRNLQRWHN